ncbi:MAG: SURF1 family protein [Propionibacterium sp.]|nr:SURF1 family protein [Propionibacterium sp.]
MRRLWLRWIGLVVFVALMGTLFVRLGEWQWHKSKARDAYNAMVRTNQVVPVAAFPGVFAPGHTIADSEQWQRITVTGSYDTAHQFQAMERSVNSQPGTEIVTPLQATNGVTVLVDRGLLPRPPGQNDPTTLPDPPAGTVTVVGYVRRDEVGTTTQITPVNHRMRLINTPAIAAQVPYPVVDGYLQLISSTPAQSGGLIPLGLPQLGSGPYFSYAIQWFMFTVMAAAGVVMMIRGDLRDRRKARRRAAVAAQNRPEAQPSDQEDSHAARTD